MQQKNGLCQVKDELTVRDNTSWLSKTFQQFFAPLKLPNKKSLDVKNIINLDDKVDAYIDWYKDKKVIGHYTDIGEYQEPIQMRNFIEKMAVWYELRYPDYEVNRLLGGSDQEPTNINDTMFKSNPYVKELIGSGTDIECLDWSDFYNFTSFFNSLPSHEQTYLRICNYPSIVYYDGYAHFHLTPDGYVTVVEGIPFLDGGIASNEYHITDIWDYMCSTHMKIPKKCEIGKVIASQYDERKKVNDMLDAVMYRIIERGGNRIGPRRAFFFAREFGRDISIPMIYGVNTSDPGLRRFISAYFKAGGSKDITCLVNYFSRASKDEKVDTITMRELLRTTPNDCIDFYTPEEKEDMQKLTSILAYVAKEKENNEKLLKQLKIVNGIENKK